MTPISTNPDFSILRYATFDFQVRLSSLEARVQSGAGGGRESSAGGGRESSAGGGRESYIGEGYSERQDERSDEDSDEGGGGGLNTETLSRLGAVEQLLNQLLDRQVWCSCPPCSNTT